MKNLSFVMPSKNPQFIHQSFEKSQKLYEGKAKVVYSVVEGSHIPRDEYCWLFFKDSLTAFNAQKKGEFPGKGALNCQIATLIFQFLEKQGISTHWQLTASENEMMVDRLNMLALEVVVRNRLAGSTAKKFGLREGSLLKAPLVEFYYKKDELNDPFMSDDQVLMLELADLGQIAILKKQALEVNKYLMPFFAAVDIELIDFKIEYGWRKNNPELILADEITPDSCRLWEKGSENPLDKDRFRKDLGSVEESYNKVWRLLKNHWGDPLQVTASIQQ